MIESSKTRNDSHPHSRIKERHLAMDSVSTFYCNLNSTWESISAAPSASAKSAALPIPTLPMRSTLAF
jgi:hypothetical protein